MISKDIKNLSFSQIVEQVEQERRAERDKNLLEMDAKYKERLESDLIICERALLNYPSRAKKINSLINNLNKKLNNLKFKHQEHDTNTDESPNNLFEELL